MQDKEDPIFSDVEDEPTPYGSIRHSSKLRPHHRDTRRMIFISSGIVAVICVVVGFAVAYSQKKTPEISPTPAPITNNSITTPATISQIQNVPPTSSPITIGVQKTKNGALITIHWSDLPAGTKKINIYYSATKDGTYRLIGTIPVTSITGGNGSLNLPNGYEGGYYYGVAAGGDGSPAETPSSSAPGNIPVIITPSSTASSSNGSGSGGNNGTGDNNNNASGTPVQNFLVQHVDQKIQISWQYLPVNTFEVVISRSASENGPWTAVLTETNISDDGPYSVEVVDDTLGDPYYYEMDVYDENNTDVATYGPLLLEPL